MILCELFMAILNCFADLCVSRMNLCNERTSWRKRHWGIKWWEGDKGAGRARRVFLFFLFFFRCLVLSVLYTVNLLFLLYFYTISESINKCDGITSLNWYSGRSLNGPKLKRQLKPTLHVVFSTLNNIFIINTNRYEWRIYWGHTTRGQLFLWFPYHIRWSSHHIHRMWNRFQEKACKKAWFKWHSWAFESL